MKSLRSYSLNIPEKDYHDYNAWSYSILAKYAREGFPALTTLHQKVVPTPVMKFGSLFDRIMTGNGAAKDEYAVCDIVIPEAEARMLDCLALITNNKAYHLIQDNEIKIAQETSGYQSRWGMEAVRKHIEPYIQYYELKVSGKEIVSAADWNDATQMADTIHSDKYLKNIFGLENSDEIEYLYQLQFVESICIDEDAQIYADVKIMPDLLKINHTKKTILPVDLKSSSMPAYQFAEHFVKMRYDLQAAVYTDVLQEVINKIPEYSDYTILPYLFTDICRIDKVPVTFEYDPRSESQIDGFSFGSDKTFIYKNWKRLLLEIGNYEIEEAKVPSYITTEGANNLLDILNSTR